MTDTTSPIAATARLETAAETLAEYIGYLSTEIDAETGSQEPNDMRVRALQQQLEQVLAERRALAPERNDLIARAIYIYGPLLAGMR